MTSSAPAEAPHFRSKTLTPESPVPIHIQESSSNIPVLQNQIDPIFNLTSTHLQPLLTVVNPGMAALQDSTERLSVVRPETNLAAANNTDSNYISFEGNQEVDAEGDDDSAMSFEDEKAADQKGQEAQATNILQNLSPSAAHPSTYPTAHESLPTLSTDETQTLYASLSQNAIKEPLESSTGPIESVTSPFIANGQIPSDHEPTEDGEGPAHSAAQNVSEGGVNYDTLLESLSPSTSTAPSAENIVSTTTGNPTESSVDPRPSSTEQPLSALPLPAGLPPRPPPQEKPSIHPNYNAENDISTFHFPQTQNPNAQPSHTSQSSNSYLPSQGFPQPVPTPNASVGANGLPPPPLATFQQLSPQAGQVQPNPVVPQQQPTGKNERQPVQPAGDNEDEQPWTPEIERLWTDFQREEAVYVSEGLWDRFPPGSRLFVGNLFTEKVTKRDLFYIFHRYGRLAQISIKNAYGFIQYLDAACCQRALQAEQGKAARGRKMHLEISKPQKNSRNATASAAGDSLRAGNKRRSRSPDYGRASQRAGGPRSGGDRYGPNDNFRGEMRRRDDYRPVRSPSPRGFRGRDDYFGPRGRSPDRYYGGRRSRSRSPFNRHGRYRSRSPQGPDSDDEASLPFPRRNIRDVPDVQVVLLDQVDRTFVGYIEKSFRDRGLRCDVLQLPPRVSLIALVKRQIIEGVQAVVRIFRQSQATGKIPLQVFDRRAGAENVQYEELDANIAAELVIRAKATHVAPQPLQQFAAAPSYSAPQYGQHPQPQQPQAVGPPNLANLITSLDGPALQKLLGAMSQSPQTPQTPQHPQMQNQQQSDLAALLGGTRQPPPQQGYSYTAPQQPPPQQQQYNAQAVHTAFASNPALASLLGNANRGPQAPMQYQPGQQPQVQNLMEQLNRWKQ